MEKERQHRTCSTCREEKPLSEYYPCKVGGERGYKRQCKSCVMNGRNVRLRQPEEGMPRPGEITGPYGLPVSYRKDQLDEYGWDGTRFTNLKKGPWGSKLNGNWSTSKSPRPRRKEAIHNATGTGVEHLH